MRKMHYDWKNVSDEEFKHFIRAKFYGIKLADFVVKRYKFYNQARVRGLVDYFAGEGTLVRATSLREMPDEDFKDYVRSNYYGLSSRAICDISSCNKEISSRGLRQYFIDEGTIVRKTINWRSVSRKDFKHWIRANHYGTYVSDLVANYSGTYNEINRRKLMNYFVRDGTILNEKDALGKKLILQRLRPNNP